MGRKTSKNKEKDYGGLSFLIECQYDVKYLSLDKAALYYHTLLKYWQEYNHDKFSENSDIQNKIINNYLPKWRWLAADIYRAAKRRGKYPTLATDTEVNSCFSIY